MSVLVGVVVCPHCRRVQVVEARAQRPHCRACGRAFELKERKSFYLGEDPDEARRVAARISLEVGHAGIEAIAETAAAVERERRGSFEDVVRALERRPEFGAADIEDERARLRVTDPLDWILEHLRRSGRVYEPRPGRFRWVP